METLKKLEDSIDLLVVSGKKLKDERDGALGAADAARKELHEAKDTIERLRQSLDSSNMDRGKSETERKKDNIIKRITSIIERLDKLR